MGSELTKEQIETCQHFVEHEEAAVVSLPKYLALGLCRVALSALKQREGWVAVSERLPEPNVDVLCMFDPSVSCAVGCYDDDPPISSGSAWYEAGGRMAHFDVDPTYWQPISAAPKSDERK